MKTNNLEITVNTTNDLRVYLQCLSITPIAAIPMLSIQDFDVPIKGTRYLGINLENMKLSPGNYRNLEARINYDITEEGDIPYNFDPEFHLGHRIRLFYDLEYFLQCYELNGKQILQLPASYLRMYSRKDYQYQAEHNKVLYYQLLAFCYATLYVKRLINLPAFSKYRDRYPLLKPENVSHFLRQVGIRINSIINTIHPEQVGNCPYRIGLMALLANLEEGSEPLDKGYVKLVICPWYADSYPSTFVFNFWLTYRLIKENLYNGTIITTKEAEE